MLDLALRTTAILLGAAAVCGLLRQAAAATRHLVLHVAIIAVLLAPLLLPITPTFDVPVLAGARERLDWIGPAFVDVSRKARVSQGPSTTPSATIQSSADPARRAPTAPLDWTSVAMKIWATGSLALVVWFAFGWIRIARMARRAPPADPRWHAELNDLCARLRIRGEIGLGMIESHTSPVVTGLRRPSILLPVQASTWDADRRRSVLLHELAHVQRGDCRVQALAQAACAMYWFNPLMWMTCARLRRERERACDDRVLLSGLTPSVYAGHLLDIARDLQRGLRGSAALAMARPSELEGRLLAVLAERHARVSAVWARALVVTSVAAIASVSLAASSSARAVANDGLRSTAGAQPYRVPLDTPAPDALPAAVAAAAQASRTLQSSGDRTVRERAVMDLIASDQDAAIDPLQTALDDPSQDVREKAALGLALRSGSEVVPALLKALADSDSQVREKAALGLAMRRDDRATAALLSAADDPDSQVREKVAMALGTSGDSRASAVLNRMLADEDSQVREKAAAGLTLLQQGAGADADAEAIRGGLRGMIAAIARLTR